MKKKDFVRMLGEFQNVKLDKDRVDQMIRPGELFDQLQLIKDALFQIDVTGIRPLEEVTYFKEGEG